jgi:hypothetical protein
MNDKRRTLPKAVRPLERLDDRITPAVASVTNPLASALVAAPASTHIGNTSNGLLIGPFVPGQGTGSVTITPNTAILRRLPNPRTPFFASRLAAMNHNLRPNTLGATNGLGTTTVGLGVNNSLLTGGITGSINTGMINPNSPLGQLLGSSLTAFNNANTGFGVNGNTILALTSIFGQTNGSGSGNFFFNPNPSATGIALNNTGLSLGTQNFNTP